MHTPADLDVQRVDRSKEVVLRNLLELYCHDMAEWFALDAREDGTYRYPAERVWNEEVEVYLAAIGRIPVGFALVGPGERYGGEPGSKDLGEFFVVRRHRRSGVGSRLARQVWDRHRARWSVRVLRANASALAFWRRAIDGYTVGERREEEREVAGRPWSYFTFEGGDRRHR